MSNLDREDKTNCLRILFGDWNDAVDGLGKTNDNDKKFGTGVSVMASLHLYRNLGEMIEIFGKDRFENLHQKKNPLKKKTT